MTNQPLLISIAELQSNSVAVHFHKSFSRSLSQAKMTESVCVAITKGRGAVKNRNIGFKAFLIMWNGNVCSQSMALELSRIII